MVWSISVEATLVDIQAQRPPAKRHTSLDRMGSRSVLADALYKMSQSLQVLLPIPSMIHLPLSRSFGRSMVASDEQSRD